MNHLLTGRTILTTSSTHINIPMDKDPYDGQIGIFHWSFRFPVNFIVGSVPADFGAAPEQMVSYKLQERPAGQGNNSGSGFVDAWSCRSLND